MSHHGSEPFDGPEFAKRHQIMRDLLNSTAEFRGAIGAYPEGKLTSFDEGSIQFAVGGQDGKVVMDFGTPVRWMGMTPQQAADLASQLMKWARLMGRKAKERIVSQMPLIEEGWTITQGGYDRAPDEAATWLIDPPYQDKGKHYRFPLSDFAPLAAWVRSRPGLTIVCEQHGADWLPFQPLGSFKSTRGRTEEVAYIAGDLNDLFGDAA